MELRTHNCGELRQSDEGKHVKLCGWLSSVRDLGAVIFFVLRDYYGYTQAVVSDEAKKEQIRAIPRESTADMIISPDYLEELCAYAAKTQNAWREEFGENDPEIAV